METSEKEITAIIKPVVIVNIQNRAYFCGCYDGIYDWKLIGCGNTLKEAVINAIAKASNEEVYELEIDSVYAYSENMIIHNNEVFHSELHNEKQCNCEEIVSWIKESNIYKSKISRAKERIEKKKQNDLAKEQKREKETYLELKAKFEPIK